MTTIDLSKQELVVNNDMRELKFTGLMTVDAASRITDYAFDIIDISEAEFEEKEVEEYVCLGWTHCGPVYGRSYMRKLNALTTILNCINTKKLILLVSLTRKQLNAVKRNCGIESILVPDGAKLFSMKDGHLYNKKGTILMFENKL